MSMMPPHSSHRMSGGFCETCHASESEFAITIGCPYRGSQRKCRQLGATSRDRVSPPTAHGDDREGAATTVAERGEPTTERAETDLKAELAFWQTRAEHGDAKIEKSNVEASRWATLVDEQMDRLVKVEAERDELTADLHAAREELATLKADVASLTRSAFDMQESRDYNRKGREVAERENSRLQPYAQHLQGCKSLMAINTTPHHRWPCTCGLIPVEKHT